MRLQESMLFDPITWRANFCARKFISFVAFEHEKMPKDVDASRRARGAQALGGAVERLVPRGLAQHAVVAHERGRQPAAALSLHRCRSSGRM